MKNKFYNKVKQVTKDIIGTSALVLLVGTAIGLQKCAKTEYEYCGMVGQDSVEFKTNYAPFSLSSNYLTFYNEDNKVKLSDGLGNNLKFEYVSITKKDGSQKTYNSSDKEVGKYVVGPWQAKADSVLPKILKIKEQEKEQERQAQIKEGLKYLK